MEKFRAAVFKIASLDRLRPLIPQRVSQIEQRLVKISSRFSTPSHPPYHAMILRAIAELNEKEGASEETISRFIVSEYDSLPWAHSRYLTHHLFKLCEGGEVISNGSGLYLIPNTVHGNASRSRKKPRKRRIKHKVGEEGVYMNNLGLLEKKPVRDIVVPPEDQQGEVMGNKPDELMKYESFEEQNLVLVCGLPVMNSTIGLNLNPPKLALPAPVAHEHNQIEESLASDDLIGEKPLGISRGSDLVNKNVGGGSESYVHSHAMNSLTGVKEDQLGFHLKPLQVAEMGNHCDPRRITEKEVLLLDSPFDSERLRHLEGSLASDYLIDEKPLGFSGVGDSVNRNIEVGDESDVHSHVMNALTGLEETELGFHPKPLQVVEMENHCDSGSITENGVPLLSGPDGNVSLQAPRRSSRRRPPKPEAVEDAVLLLDWMGSRNLQPTLQKRGRGRPPKRRGRSSTM